jgi:hypothetical protein
MGSRLRGNDGIVAFEQCTAGTSLYYNTYSRHHAGRFEIAIYAYCTI